MSTAMRRYCMTLVGVVSVLLLSPAFATVPALVQPTRNAADSVASGTLSGVATKDYRFQGKLGQQLRITLKGNPAVYFLVWQPEAQQMTTVETRDWWGALPAGGEYIVRVFIYPEEAKKGLAAHYALYMQWEKGTTPSKD